MTVNRLLIARCFFACFTLACLSGVLAGQPRMGLVGPGVGWVLQYRGAGPGSDDHLFWTSDDGANWKDVTPQDPASRHIAGVFFLDASRGWVLLALKREPPKNSQEPDDFITDVRGFDLASTTDGGATWTIKRLDALPEGVGWMGASEIFFLDAAHGWMTIASPVPHWGGEGALLATIDGGNTWKPIVQVNGGGGYGPIRFTDPLNGWIAGGTDDKYLYATHDGGRHWAEIQLPVPREVSNLFRNGAVAAQYAPPVFKDVKHGVLCVTYFEPGAEEGEDFRTLTLFSTNDGGLTWHSESSVNLGQDRGVLAFTAVDSQAIAPKLSGPSGLIFMKLGLAGKATETAASGLTADPNTTAVSGLDFSDTSHGWASLSDGRLLSTPNGGITWKDVTPGRKKTSMLAPSGTTNSGSSGALTQSGAAASPPSGPIATASTISTYKSRHLGFDRCTLPSTSQMSTWWNSSPYFDYGVYVGGSNTGCASVKSSWVNTVTTMQGWGLIPIWVGPQAPCTCAPTNPPSTWPNCTKFWSTTIDTGGGAYFAGQTEADSATSGTRSAMQKLGLGPGSVIYYDIENYTPSATCDGNPTGSYVNSFLNGWVSELQRNGYIAGVYGNPAPAESWYIGGTGYGAVSPSPNDIWIVKYKTNNITIWGLTGLDDTAWPRDQRIHQYLKDQSQSWGTPPVTLTVDPDIEDADITGGNGAKSYSFSYNTAIDYPGVVGTTLPYAINNTGQIAGWYADSVGVDHGFLYDGVTTFTNIDFPGATATQAYGINNAGSIVGLYSDVAGNIHAFLNQGGTFGTYTNLDYPSATSTAAAGINDDNQISGYYTDSLGTYHGFLYQAGNFTNIDYPLATGTDLNGINGDAQIAGICPNGDCPAFLYSQGTFIYPPVQGLGGVNNNDQVTGSIGQNVVFEHEGSSITLACPGGSHTNPGTGLSDFILNSQTKAKVAIAGSCVISGVVHGFLATSQ